MDREAFRSIIRRYPSLAETLERVSSSLREANPAAELKVSFSSELVGCAFMERPCWSLDGATSRIRIVDEKRESRHSMRLLAYDRRQRLLGVYLWRPGKPGTPSAALGSGRIAAKAVDYAIVTHREWFERGEVPPGIPDASAAPGEILGAEVGIRLYGTSGVPSVWIARDYPLQLRGIGYLVVVESHEQVNDDHGGPLVAVGELVLLHAFVEQAGRRIE